MKRRPFLASILTAVMLILVLAACGGEATSEATSTPQETPLQARDEPTATIEPEDSATISTDTEPTVTSERPSSTERPIADNSGRLIGAASVDDDEGDVVNLLMQEPDEPMPGIDLVHIQLEGDGEQLVATIQTSGDIEADLEDDTRVSFDVHLWQDDKPAYALSFHYERPGEWEATVTDYLASILGDEDTVDTPITVDGNAISASFPVTLLPDLDNEFEWYASVMMSDNGMLLSPDAWFDGAPENIIQLLATPEKFVTFPQ